MPTDRKQKIESRGTYVLSPPRKLNPTCGITENKHDIVIEQNQNKRQSKKLLPACPPRGSCALFFVVGDLAFRCFCRQYLEWNEFEIKWTSTD